MSAVSAEYLVDKFILANRLPPTSRVDFLFTYKDTLSAVSEEDGIRILELALEERPHLRAPERVVIPVELAERAFGESPSLAARGELVAAVGADAYRHALQLWGADEKDLKPGKRPAGDTDAKVSVAPVAKPKGDDSRTNPFSDGYEGTDTVRAQEIGKLITSLGKKAVCKMAANAGRDLAGRSLQRKKI